MPTLVLTLALAGCRAQSADDGRNEVCEHKIGFVAGIGGVNDGNVNEVGWNGVVAGAEALGLDETCYGFVKASDGSDVIPSIETLIAEGYDIIVTSGFTLRDATREAARQHPDVTFIGVEQMQISTNYQPDPLENVAGVVFHEDVEGFLAGALAGLVSKTDLVGGIFGCEIIPPTMRYRVGFRNGAQHINPDVDLRIATHPGSLDVCFFDPEYGAELANDLLAEGADTIFVAARQTGLGALAPACEGDANLIRSGFEGLGSLPEMQDCIVATVTRDVSGGVRDLIVAVDKDTFTGGDVFGEVGLAYHDSENILSQDIKDQLDELAGQLAAGEIDACAPPNEGTFCTPVR
jgi:basic membrane protein A